ncbi:MAG: NADH-quinone oxidoreductase subunit C [Nitrospinota bacterium]
MSEPSITLQLLQERFRSVIREVHTLHGDDTVVIEPDANRDVLRFCKEEPKLAYSFLMDVTCVDYLHYPGREGLPRFAVVYHLYSLEHNHRVRITCPVAEDDPAVASVVELWPIADWLEREAWDMFGVTFTGHPDLRRILLYEEFEGHPLRKDYPIARRQPLVGPKN